MLAEAYELELLRTNAGRVRVTVGRSHVTSTAPRALTREQYAALVEHVRLDDRLLVMLLRWTGLRIAEALGLRWEDFCDLGDGPVLLVRRQWQDVELVEHTKTSPGPGRWRRLKPCSRTRRRPDTDPVRRCGGPDLRHDARHPPGQPQLPQALAPRSQGGRRAVDDPAHAAHSLATELVDRGYDISAVARVLGHRSEHFTRRIYVHAKATPRFYDLDT